MDKEQIKAELISEVEKSIQKNFSNKHLDSDKLNALISNLKSTGDFTKFVIEKLNEILRKHEIILSDESEKNELISFLKPTIQILTAKHIKH